jgi:hypothetical protein
MDLSKFNPEVAEDLEATQRTIETLTEAYIIVGGPKEQIIGTLDFKVMFIWTSLEKATEFIEQNLDSKEEKPLKKTLGELLELGRRLGFRTVRFDFRAKGCPAGYPFINYNLGNGTGILDLLATFANLN